MNEYQPDNDRALDAFFDDNTEDQFFEPERQTQAPEPAAPSYMQQPAPHPPFQSQPYPPQPYGYQNQPCAYPPQQYGYPYYLPHAPAQVYKRNPAVIALLGAILAVGLAILMIQLFGLPGRPADSAPGANKTGNGGFRQDGNPFFGGGEGPDTFGQGPGQDGNPFFGGNGDEGPRTFGPGQDGENGGGIMIRRGANGKMEFSTDGGKTWSETPPWGNNGE